MKLNRYNQRCERCNEMIGFESLGEPIRHKRASEILDDIMEEHLLICGNDNIHPEDADKIMAFYRELKKEHRKHAKATTETNQDD